MGSCTSDKDDETCRKKGSLSAKWSDGSNLKFNHNIYTEQGSQNISVQSSYDADFCAKRIHFSITELSTSIGRHELKRYNDDGIFEQGTASITTWDTDALTEAYELETTEPHWIEVTEVGSDRVKGLINASFVIDQNTIQKAWNFPDTLRFNQESFELVKRSQ